MVMFFLSPFVMHTLGATEYGIWQLLTVLTGYMGILDLGVRASTGRYIILYLGKKDYDKVDETIRTGLGLYSLLSCLILLAGITLGLIFPSIFPSVPVEYHNLIAILLPVLAINIWILAISVILSSILGAYERFDIARGADLLVLAIRAVGTIVVLKNGLGLIGLTVTIIVSNLIGLLMNFYLSSKIYTKLKLWPILKKDRIKELYNYGIGAFIIAASAKIIGQTDLVLVGNLFDIDSVTIYSVGAMIVYYSGPFTNLLATTYFPSLQKAVARGAKNEAKSILYKQVYVSLIIGLLMYIGYISFGRPFIILWMHNPSVFPMGSVETAAKIMATLSCARLLLLLSSFSRNLLAASGFIGFAAKLRVIEATLNLFFSISFVVFFDWGLWGIAAGTFVSNLLIHTIILPNYACKKAGLNWFEILLKVGIKGLVTGFILWLFCNYIQTLYVANTWTLFFSQVGIVVCIYIPMVWLIILPAAERGQFLRKIKKVINSSK